MYNNQNAPGSVARAGRELHQCWQRLPNKGFFLGLLGAWLLLFNSLGSSTLGYLNTTSLFRWMYNAYSNSHGTSEDGHGVLMPFVVLALFWWKRKELLSLPHRVWWPGLLLLAGALGLHVLGYMVQQPRISIIALFGGIYALMGLAWGPVWLRASFFPFFLFAFCVPLAAAAEPVTIPLRHLVSRAVTAICNNLLGMNVIREGTLLFNSQRTYQYEVAAACSGVRSLIAIFALSTIYGFMNFKQGWKRLLFMASTVPLALLGNIIRLMAIILAAEVSGQSAGDYVHESSIFSLLPYLPAIAGMLVLGRALQAHPLQPASRVDSGRV